MRGKKPGHLDFEYQISVSKTGNDILVSLGRTNKGQDLVDAIRAVHTGQRVVPPEIVLNGFWG